MRISDWSSDVCSSDLPNADALVESALRHIEILKRHNFEDFKVSLKASEVFLTVFAYQKLAKLIDQPLHLGITEAGGLRAGAVKRSIGLGKIGRAACRERVWR